MPRQVRSPVSRWVLNAFALHREAERTGIPVDDLRGEGLTRRELLGAGAGLVAGAALATRPAQALARPARRTDAPRIAIVGAGLAGLRCAHLLWTGQPGDPLATSVYEANPERAGGRCW